MTLKEARLKRRLTQDELAEQSGVAQSVISKLENGEGQSPSWETVALLSRALKFKPEEIFPVGSEQRAAS